MVVTGFRPCAGMFVTRSGTEAARMTSSMWSRPKQVGGVLAAALGMMAAAGINPGYATAADVGPGQHLSLSAQCTTPPNGILATCDAVAPGGDTTVICVSDAGCRYTVTATGQKQGEDSEFSSGSWIRACARVTPLNPKGPYDRNRLQCGDASPDGPQAFNGTLKSGDQAILQASVNGTNWQVASVEATVDG